MELDQAQSPGAHVVHGREDVQVDGLQKYVHNLLLKPEHDFEQGLERVLAQASGEELEAERLFVFPVLGDAIDAQAELHAVAVYVLADQVVLGLENGADLFAVCIQAAEAEDAHGAEQVLPGGVLDGLVPHGLFLHDGGVSGNMAQN